MGRVTKHGRCPGNDSAFESKQCQRQAGRSTVSMQMVNGKSGVWTDDEHVSFGSRSDRWKEILDPWSGQGAVLREPTQSSPYSLRKRRQRPLP